MRELRVDLRAETATALFDHEVLGARDIIDELAVCFASASAALARTRDAFSSTHKSIVVYGSSVPVYSSQYSISFTLTRALMPTVQ